MLAFNTSRRTLWQSFSCRGGRPSCRGRSPPKQERSGGLKLRNVCALFHRMCVMWISPNHLPSSCSPSWSCRHPRRGSPPAQVLRRRRPGPISKRWRWTVEMPMSGVIVVALMCMYVHTAGNMCTIYRPARDKPANTLKAGSIIAASYRTH